MKKANLITGSFVPDGLHIIRAFLRNYFGGGNAHNGFFLRTAAHGSIPFLKSTDACLQAFMLNGSVIDKIS